LGDTNTPSPHNKGAPTLYAIPEASTFLVHAIQRYDRYPDENYPNFQTNIIYERGYFFQKAETSSLIGVLRRGF